MVELMVQVKDLLALNIKAFRKKCGFSQEKLAEVANLSTQTISDIEGCRTWVSDKSLERLAEALNVDIFQLFIPFVKDFEDNLETLKYDRIMKLGSILKKDIDNHLNQFYLSEKSLFR